MTRKEILSMLTNDVNVENLISACCYHFDISKSEFYSKKRDAEIVKARYVAIHILKNRTSYSLNRIAMVLRPNSPFDHTTVIHAIKCVDNWRKYEEDFAMRYEIISQQPIVGTDDIPLPEDILLREYDAYLKRKENCL